MSIDDYTIIFIGYQTTCSQATCIFSTETILQYALLLFKRW